MTQKKRTTEKSTPAWLQYRMLLVVRTSEVGDPTPRHFGVFAPPVEHLLGAASRERGAPPVYDVTGDAHLRVVDVRWFLGWVADGDFEATEILFAPPDRVALARSAFGAAHACRSHFLSKRLARGALAFWQQNSRKRERYGEAARRLGTAIQLLRKGEFTPFGGTYAATKSACVALAHQLSAAVKSSRLRDAPLGTEVDSVCATVVGATLGHRIRVPVQGEWKSEPMEFEFGTLYNLDLQKGT
jgi:hypothetical protein